MHIPLIPSRNQEMMHEKVVAYLFERFFNSIFFSDIQGEYHAL